MKQIVIQISGSGILLPAREVTSAHLDLRLGKPEGWLQARCGVASRYVVGETETQEGLAAKAALSALDDAGLLPSDVDVLISACSVARQPIPAMAPLIARCVGVPPGSCMTFDVNSTCLSFLTAVQVADAVMQRGGLTNVVVVSSEVPSKAVDWTENPETAGLFGDGAAAVVLSAMRTTERHVLKASLFESHHDGYEFCQIESGGTKMDFRNDLDAFKRGSYFHMDGKSLFKITAERFPGFVDKILDIAEWSRGDVDLVVPHQASPLALRHLISRCHFPVDRVVDIVASHGNQVAASIPIAFHIARRDGRIGPGAKVLMLGTSAGVGFGGLALEFPR